MIVSCPSCATSYDLPGGNAGADGSIIRCASCGHSWLESSAVEVLDVADAYDGYDDYDEDDGYDDCSSTAQLPAIYNSSLPASLDDGDDSYDLDIEAMRLTRASIQAERKHTEALKRRRRQLRGWSILGGAIAATLGALALFPAEVTRHAPGMALIYERVGLDTGIPKFEIANIQQQHILADGTRVFAIRGEVKNLARKDSYAPALRFILRDANDQEVYAWTLASVTSRTLKPSESTNFVTRIASPPESADDLQIRFARANEIGSNARP